jgi:N-acetylglucosamine-6-phosphate deacetylase
MLFPIFRGFNLICGNLCRPIVLSGSTLLKKMLLLFCLKAPDINLNRRFSPREGALHSGPAINIRKNEKGEYVYFDPHVNGYYNARMGIKCDFWNCPDDDQIKKFSGYQFKKGILAFYPTLITGSIEEFERNLARIKEFRKKHYRSEAEAHQQELSYIRGVHIEGGLISKKGVHPKEYTNVFQNLKTVKALVEKYQGLIKMWTLCPTMDPNGKITKYLQSQGILVSYGHSDATYSQAMKAFEQHGVKTITHWGNTMFLHKNIRNARDITDEQIRFILNPNSIKDASNKDDFGIGYYALHDPNVTLQVICGSPEAKDVHLNPKLLRAVYQHKGPEKIALVSDVACNPRRTNTLRGANQLVSEHRENLGRLLAKPESEIQKS